MVDPFDKQNKFTEEEAELDALLETDKPEPEAKPLAGPEEPVDPQPTIETGEQDLVAEQPIPEVESTKPEQQTLDTLSQTPEVSRPDPDPVKNTSLGARQGIYDGTDWDRMAQTMAYPDESAELNQEDDAKSFFGDSAWTTIKDAALSLYKGVGQGAVETIDTINWAARNAQKLDPITIALDWLTDTTLGGDSAARREQIGQRSEQATDQIQQRLDAAIPTETGSGELSQSVGKLVSGFVGGGVFTKGIKSIRNNPGLLDSMTKGALAEFLAFDENTQNMSETLNELGILPDAANFLSKKDTNGKFEKKLKNLIDGAIGGVMAEGVMNSLKVLKKLSPYGWNTDGTPTTINNIAESLAKDLPVESQASFVENIINKAGRGYSISRDTVIHTMQAAYLSGMKTQITNIIGNSFTSLNSLGERAIARGLTKYGIGLKGKRGVEAGEVSAQFNGMYEGLFEGLRLLKQSWKTGDTMFDDLSKLDVSPSFSAQKVGVDDNSLLGKGLNAWGQIINIPGRSLGATDVFFKAVNYRTELSSLATRQAVREGLTGKELEKRVSQLYKEPTSELMQQAKRVSEVNTFTNDLGKFASKIEGIRNEFPAAKIVIPFYKTLANLTKYELERFPVTSIMFKNQREAIAAGGEEAALALAKMGMGSIHGLLAMGLYNAGLLTDSGPNPKTDYKAYQTKLASGWRPHSIKVGDSYVDITKIDPIGPVIKLWSTMFELSEYVTEPDQADTLSDMFGVVISTTAQALTNSTWAEESVKFFDAVRDPKLIQKYVSDKTASIVPSAVRQANNIWDPYVRDAQTLLDKFRKSIPGLSDDLPIKYDVYGRPLEKDNSIIGLFLPVTSAREESDPSNYDVVFAEQGFEFSSPRYTQSFGGTRVDLRDHPKVFSRMQELTGTLKNPRYGNKTLDEYLGDLVSGKSPFSKIYDKMTDGPDGGKRNHVNDVLLNYRKLARDTILIEDDEFRSVVESERDIERAKTNIYSQMLQ